MSMKTFKHREVGNSHKIEEINNYKIIRWETLEAALTKPLTSVFIKRPAIAKWISSLWVVTKASGMSKEEVEGSVIRTDNNVTSTVTTNGTSNQLNVFPLRTAALRKKMFWLSKHFHERIKDALVDSESWFNIISQQGANKSEMTSEEDLKAQNLLSPSLIWVANGLFRRPLAKINFQFTIDDAQLRKKPAVREKVTQPIMEKFILRDNSALIEFTPGQTCFPHLSMAKTIVGKTETYESSKIITDWFSSQQTQHFDSKPYSITRKCD